MVSAATTATTIGHGLELVGRPWSGKDVGMRCAFAGYLTTCSDLLFSWELCSFQQGTFSSCSSTEISVCQVTLVQ